jgi:hypothetical protein
MAAIVAVSALAFVALLKESKETKRHKRNRHRQPKGGRARGRYGHSVTGSCIVTPVHEQEYQNDETVQSMDPRVVCEMHERDKDARREVETQGTNIP